MTPPLQRTPVSKLFLSVDLTGSTAFKQRPFDPKSPWQKVFLQFYREFPQVLHQQQQGDPAEGLRFQLWKAIGDELLFTCDPPVRKSALLATVNTRDHPAPAGLHPR